MWTPSPAETAIFLARNEEDVTLRCYNGSRTSFPRSEALRISPALTSNNGEVVRAWAVAGLGVALRSEWDVAPSVKRGELHRLFAEYEFEAAGEVLEGVASRHADWARSRLVNGSLVGAT
jgi:DNA-binding transcriptional LysR family regulator